MGSRGPLPNPKSQRYDSRPAPDRTLADLPAGELGVARMPSWLDDDARRFWHTYAGKLRPLGRLTKLDESAFALLADCYSQIRQLEAQIEELGLILTGPRGGQSANPLIRIRASAYRQFLEGAKQFGLSPASRERLKAPQERRGRPPVELRVVGRTAGEQREDPRHVLKSDTKPKTDPRDVLRNAK